MKKPTKQTDDMSSLFKMALVQNKGVILREQRGWGERKRKTTERGQWEE
jgi:hypothetical protein